MFKDFVTWPRFRLLVKRIEELAESFGSQLGIRGFKTGGSAGQVPKKVNSTNFNWAWAFVTWDEVTGKPTIFPTNIANVDGLQTALDTLTNTKAPAASPVFTGTIELPVYTVATLPAGTVGQMAYVTDATTPTYNGALTGGGAVVVPVFHNGSAWVAH